MYLCRCSECGSLFRDYNKVKDSIDFYVEDIEDLEVLDMEHNHSSYNGMCPICLASRSLIPITDEEELYE